MPFESVSADDPLPQDEPSLGRRASDPPQAPAPVRCDAAIRIVMVIPGREHDQHLMPFVRRQFRDLASVPGLDVQPFYLSSRIAPQALWRSRRELRRLCKTFRPHLIHAQFGTMTSFWTATSGAFRDPTTWKWRPWGPRTQLVISCRGSDLNPTPGDPWWRGTLARLLTQLATLRARQVICVSAELQQRLWWARSRSVVIPNGVDLETFHPVDQQRARAQLGWHSDQPVVLFNARNDPRGKRLDLAEGAVEIARQTIPNLRLEILRGTTPPQQMPIYLSAADALLMTSDFEGSPNIVKESLACNLPVVAVPVGDVPQRLAGVEPSAVCQRDPRDLAERLVEILTAGGRSNGREIIARDLGSSAVAQRIAQLYRQTAG